MDNTKHSRLLAIFLRALRGEDLSVQRLADDFSVTAKSITRTINDLKAFLADHRDLVGNAQLQYSYRTRCYRLHMDEFLSNRELFALVEILIGTRALSREDLTQITDKLKRFTSVEDQAKMHDLIRNELYCYQPVRHDCQDLQGNLMQLINCIRDRREISIEYYRMDRAYVTHRLRPVCVMFSDYYFYLVAFKTNGSSRHLYFRIDRIKHLIEHRKTFSPDQLPEFSLDLLRRRSLFMWPGGLRTIRFEFSGPSVQAVLDKLPTARIIQRMDNNKVLIETEAYGDGIKLWLLSQGSWVKVVAPDEFVRVMQKEIEAMHQLYKQSE